MLYTIVFLTSMGLYSEPRAGDPGTSQVDYYARWYYVSGKDLVLCRIQKTDTRVFNKKEKK